MGVCFPRRQADPESGALLAQHRGQLLLACGQARVGKPEPGHLDVVRTEQIKRGGRFRGTGPRDDRGISAGVRRLTIGDRDQPHPHAGGGQDSYGPPDPEDLIVGMGCHHHDAWPGPRVGRRQVP